MKRRIWIVGPIAWDTILHFDSFPLSGKFTAPTKSIDRVGGSAGNIAQSLASSGVDAGFVTVIGTDDIGKKLHASLLASDLKHLDIIWNDGPSGKCLVFVEKDGERAIIPFGGNIMHQLTIKNTPIDKDDIVVFPNWFANLNKELAAAQAKGCFTVVGLSAVLDPQLPRADIAIGSTSDLPEDIDPRIYLDRFPRIVYTQGMDGVDQYEKGSVIHQDAFPAKTIDTTGAGDAFLSGYMSAYALGMTDGIVGMEAGARWASLMVSIEASVPPNWSEVIGGEKLF